MRRIFTMALGGLLLTMAVTGGAVAKSPHSVDPLTMTPALNPNFTWACFEAGVGITCQGTWVNGPYNEPFGLVCDGQEVWVSGVGYEQMTRWHDSEGRATKTIVHLDYPGDRFTLSPTSDGPAVTAWGHWNRHYTYGVPGDPTTRVLTERGANFVVKDPGGKVILRDVGQVEFAPGADFEVIVRSPGQHDLYEDWPGFEPASAAN